MADALPDRRNSARQGAARCHAASREVQAARGRELAARPGSLSGRPLAHPQQPGSLQQPGFGDVAAASHNDAYWTRQLEFWKEKTFFQDRLKYVAKSIEAYLAGDYVTSIYVLVPQFEGIVKDYLTTAGVTPRYRVESRIDDLKKLVLSRKVLMFPRPVLDQIFTFIETGTFLTETTNINAPGTEVTRHGIAHGSFKNFDNRDIALKYLILMDSLAYILLHDKLLAGTL